jgi:hypothetical protein
VSSSGSTLSVPVVLASVVLTLPKPVGPQLLDVVLRLLLTWLSLPSSTAASVTGAPTGAGTAVAYTFALRIALTGRLLQGGVAGIDALLEAKLNDGSLVAAVAESGLAPALGFDSADSLIQAVAALPAALALPSVSATPSASRALSQGGPQVGPQSTAAAGGLSPTVIAVICAVAGVVLGSAVAAIAVLLALRRLAARVAPVTAESSDAAQTSEHGKVAPSGPPKSAAAAV